MSIDDAVTSFAVGAVVSLASSWVLVSRLERVGERLGLSEALLGILAALAADTPEITASVTALSTHQRTIGAGVVIGSNVFNLAALLGLGAIVAGRVVLHRKVVVLGGGVAIWVALVCLLAVVGAVDAIVGLVLVFVALVPYIVLLGQRRRARLVRLPVSERWRGWFASAVDEEELELVVAIRPPRARPRDSFEAVVALVVVIGASVTMERGASRLGAHYDVAQIVIGGLVLAAVTSLPNAVAAVYLAGKGRGAAALSTGLNSNTFNVLAGLLIPSTVIGLAKPSGQATLVVGWYIGLTVFTLALAYHGHGLRRWQGWLIVAGYGAFVLSLLRVS